MLFLFWVVLILFTIVKSKIVHYSSLCYFPLTFLAATSVYNLIEGRIAFNKWMKTGIAFIGGIYALLLIALPWIMMHPERLSPLFNDPFAQGNLEAAVSWTGWEMLPGIWLLGVLWVSLRWIGEEGNGKAAHQRLRRLVWRNGCVCDADPDFLHQPRGKLFAARRH